MYSLLRKGVIGIGVTGILMAGAGIISSNRTLPTFDMLDAHENEVLASSPDLHSAVQAMSIYAPLDRHGFNTIVGQCVRIAKYAAQPSSRNTHRVDAAGLRVTSRIRKIRRRVAEQSVNVSEILSEFDETASTLKEAIESHSFNMHQQMSSF